MSEVPGGPFGVMAIAELRRASALAVIPNSNVTSEGVETQEAGSFLAHPAVLGDC
jgi:hypothetical protein